MTEERIEEIRQLKNDTVRFNEVCRFLDLTEMESEQLKSTIYEMGLITDVWDGDCDESSENFIALAWKLGLAGELGDIGRHL
jgi:hypothetical protein